jgi:hypothetical protein
MSVSVEPTVSPSSRIIRCLYEREGDQWQAFSLEFGLAAQASSINEAESKLESMVRSYVFDALFGEDRQHASMLLNRKATKSVYIRYYYTLFLSWLKKINHSNNTSYRGTYELPICCGA